MRFIVCGPARLWHEVYVCVMLLRAERWRCPKRTDHDFSFNFKITNIAVFALYVMF